MAKMLSDKRPEDPTPRHVVLPDADQVASIRVKPPPDSILEPAVRRGLHARIPIERLGSCGANPGIPMDSAYRRSICQKAFSPRRSPSTSPARFTLRKSNPSAGPAAELQASMATFAQLGMGVVRAARRCPTRRCGPACRADQRCTSGHSVVGYARRSGPQARTVAGRTRGARLGPG